MTSLFSRSRALHRRGNALKTNAEEEMSAADKTNSKNRHVKLPASNNQPAKYSKTGQRCDRCASNNSVK